jgi:hypothetical protein
MKARLKIDRELVAPGGLLPWAIITVFSVPLPTRFVRDMTTFVRNEDDSWRRDDERHENVLIETARVPALLADHGVKPTVAKSFGAEQLPVGLRTVIGHKAS